MSLGFQERSRSSWSSRGGSPGSLESGYLPTRSIFNTYLQYFNGYYDSVSAFQPCQPYYQPWCPCDHIKSNLTPHILLMFFFINNTGPCIQMLPQFHTGQPPHHHHPLTSLSGVNPRRSLFYFFSPCQASQCSASRRLGMAWLASKLEFGLGESQGLDCPGPLFPSLPLPLFKYGQNWG